MIALRLSVDVFLHQRVGLAVEINRIRGRRPTAVWTTVHIVLFVLGPGRLPWDRRCRSRIHICLERLGRRHGRQHVWRCCKRIDIRERSHSRERSRIRPRIDPPSGAMTAFFGFLQAIEA